VLEIADLARGAAELLAPALPLLVDFSTGVGSRVSEAMEKKVSDAAMQIWDSVRSFFEGDERRMEVVRDVAAKPKDELATGALQYELAKIFAAHPEIASGVGALLSSTTVSGDHITQTAHDHAVQIGKIGSITHK